ncbi:16S rRNA (uracil(1498)-N(3))-methyltransferase [Limnobacter sp.]|uniref:16S rRNA (uracil(1498)-N(3))-methyltransferase n=1 Tax=Limnobacter sp. TaxID=2003368 RepID=UPI0035113BCA
MKQNNHKRLARFYLPQAAALGQTLELPEDLMHYASRVLRLKDKEPLRLWNGLGQEWTATLEYLSKKLAQVTITDGPHAQAASELTGPIHVLQALPEGDKMDWVLEKCTELGANAFYPVQATRSVVKLNEERANKRQLHWERVLVAASLQSERQHLPSLHPVLGLQDTLCHIQHSHPTARLLWFTPEAEQSAQSWAAKTLEQGALPSPLVICVGPEGGWTPEETEYAISQGALPLRFSRRILRTETFGVACLAQLTALLGLDPLDPFEPEQSH